MLLRANPVALGEAGMRHVRCVVVAIVMSSSIVAVQAAPIGATPVFTRERLADVSWGEIEFAESEHVEAPYRNATVAFPHALGLEFVLYRREELPSVSGAGGIEVKATHERTAAFYIAADLGGGDAAWRKFVDALTAKVERLSPAGYDRFLNEALSNLSLLGWEFKYAICKVQGGKDEAFSGHAHDESAGFETARDPVPACSALRRALQYAPRTRRVVSGFTVASRREERVDATVVVRSGEEFATLPKGARLDRRAPEPGTSGYGSSSSHDGVDHHEQQLPAIGGETEAIVIGEALAAELPPGLTRRRAVLIRWFAGERTARLGAEPSEMAGGEVTVDQGVFFLHEPPGADAVPSYRAAVATRLAQSSQAIVDALPYELGHEIPNPWLRSALVVVCRTNGAAGEIAAEYCVADACAAVTNAHTICDELRQALNR